MGVRGQGFSHANNSVHSIDVMFWLQFKCGHGRTGLGKNGVLHRGRVLCASESISWYEILNA